MISKNSKTSILLLLIFFSILLLHSQAFCKQPPSLEEGINQYKKENYEEAIEALLRARSEDPASSVAAFFLGLAYKQILEYEKALIQFRDAATLPPRIKEAVIELVDVAIQLGKTQEARKWIDVAERENISPAKTYFLKGLLLTGEGKNKAAAEAFEKAKTIDPSIAQAADVQIAMCYMRARELKKAKEIFQTVILRNPQSDLAGFARQYLDIVEERLFAERPLRFSLGIFGQYDDNMVLKPTDESLATGITNQSSGVLNSSFNVSYVPILKGPWLFNAQYGFSSSLHQKNVHTHDSIVNTISVTPGYSFGKYSLNLATTYTHALVRDPSYQKYSGYLSTGPLFRMFLKNNQLLELFAGYVEDEYYQPALAEVDDRDFAGFSSSASWIWLFKKDCLLNLKYRFSDQNADGSNWDYTSHDVSANITFPLLGKVKLQLAGQAQKQDYKNTNTWFDVKRRDTTYTLSCGFFYECRKNTILVAQYTRIRDDSNIGIYDYERNLYTGGLEYRF